MDSRQTPLLTSEDLRQQALRRSADLVGKVAIGGKLVTRGGNRFLTEDPTSQRPLGEVVDVGPDELEWAVELAGAAQARWEKEGWEVRSRKLHEVADRIRAVEDELAALDTIDGGNPFRTAQADARRAEAHLRYIAGLGPELKGTVYGWQGDPVQEIRLSRREPYGVVGVVTAFNHPLLFTVIGIAAPLIAGNAVIVKPADHTTLSSLRLAELIGEVFPSGLVNVLTGTGQGLGSLLASHPRLRRITLTGSLPAGQSVLRSAAPTIKRVTLELGGKNPMIVLGDVDPKAAVAAAVSGMNLLATAGQSCGSTSRLLVHESVVDEFVRLLSEEVAGITVGDPFDPATGMGPLCHRRHYDRVRGFIAAAVEGGSRLVTGGGRPPGLDRGYFLQPTVFADVPPRAEIAREETFGPVVAVVPWSDLDQAVDLANDSRYGLTANIWSSDLKDALTLAERIQAGFVWINGNGQRPLGVPFGGYKASGLGRDCGIEEVLGYTQEKTILLSYAK
jgi:betaine-aldehyde dehydrogenase